MCPQIRVNRDKETQADIQLHMQTAASKCSVLSAANISSASSSSSTLSSLTISPFALSVSLSLMNRMCLSVCSLYYYRIARYAAECWFDIALAKETHANVVHMEAFSRQRWTRECCCWWYQWWHTYISTHTIISSEQSKHRLAVINRSKKVYPKLAQSWPAPSIEWRRRRT